MSTGLPFSENKVYTGNNGRLIDANGLPIQEVEEFNAKLNFEHADVKVVGSDWTGKKRVGRSGTGTIKMLQISVDLVRAIAEAANDGREFVTQLVGEMGNDEGDRVPVLLENVKFTGSIDLAKFQAQQMTENDLEFSFVGYRYLN